MASGPRRDRARYPDYRHRPGPGTLRGGRRKNDRIDAAAAACVAALQGDARPVAPEGPTDVLALLDERRTNMCNSRTRIVNQQHALLWQLLAGGAPTSLTATAATALLRGFRARSEVDRTRVGMCRDLIADIRRLDCQLASNEKQMTQVLDEHGPRLREVDGIGAVTAARLIGRTGLASRFPTSAAYANYNGSAPVQIASADTDRHRLPLRRPTTQQRALHHRGGPGCPPVLRASSRSWVPRWVARRISGGCFISRSTGFGR
nr:transposase [Rhodococcus opacus]